MRLVATALVAAGFPAVLIGQTSGTIRAVVVDSVGRGVVGAAVTLSGRTSTTAVGGVVEFLEVASGTYLIEVRAVGYIANSTRVTLRPNQPSIEVQIGLQRAPRQLDSLVVESDVVERASARLRGFEHRRQTGLGRYLARADIDRLRANSVGQLLRMIPSGVTLRDSLGIPLAISNRGKKLAWDAEMGGYRVVSCVLRTAVDGQLMPWGTSIDMLDPTQIAGIEIYLGASEIPAELAAGGTDLHCGLIVLWTR